MSEGVQTTLEFFNEVAQTFFCNRYGQSHKVGECPKDGGEGGDDG